MDESVFHVLLVEDNPADIFLFREVLKETGLKIELTVISDGAEALALVRKYDLPSTAEPPRLILLDLNLPKNGGVEVLEAIRQNSAIATVPVIITSSCSSPEDQATVKRLRAEYLSKPPDLDDFFKLGGIFKQTLLAGRLIVEFTIR